MKSPDPASEGFRYGVLIGAFVLIGLLAAIDVVTDLDEGVSIPHVLAEGAVIAIALAAIVWLVRALLQRNRELDRRLADAWAHIQAAAEAALQARLRAIAVFPMEGRPARMTKSLSWNPPVSLSRSVKPEGTPVISPPR